MAKSENFMALNGCNWSGWVSINITKLSHATTQKDYKALLESFSTPMLEFHSSFLTINYHLLLATISLPKSSLPFQSPIILETNLLLLLKLCAVNLQRAIAFKVLCFVKIILMLRKLLTHLLFSFRLFSISKLGGNLLTDVFKFSSGKFMFYFLC